MTFLEALHEEKRIMKDVAVAELAYQEGRYKHLLPDYLDEIKQRAVTRHKA